MLASSCYRPFYYFFHTCAPVRLAIMTPAESTHGTDVALIKRGDVCRREGKEMDSET